MELRDHLTAVLINAKMGGVRVEERLFAGPGRLSEHLHDIRGLLQALARELGEIEGAAQKRGE